MSLSFLLILFQVCLLISKTCSAKEVDSSFFNNDSVDKSSHNDLLEDFERCSNICKQNEECWMDCLSQLSSRMSKNSSEDVEEVIYKPKSRRGKPARLTNRKRVYNDITDLCLNMCSNHVVGSLSYLWLAEWVAFLHMAFWKERDVKSQEALFK